MNQIFPIVSVIIPVYNGESYLEESVFSCINQTYKNIEIIIVNDASSDNTENIIKKFKDKRIKSYKIKSSNSCKARNYGISKAKGLLYQFLDHDDVLHDKKIEEQVNLYKIHGDNFIYSCKMGTINENKKSIDQPSTVFHRNFNHPEYFEIQLNNFGLFLSTGIWLVPSNLIISTHGWDENAGLNDDGEYFMRLILNSAGIIFSKNSIFYYRRNVPNSLSKVFDSKDVYKKWLYSYTSYVKNFQLKYEKDFANYIGWKALSIYYCNSYPAYPDLLEKCLKQINDLGYLYPSAYGGKLFKIAARLIGVKNSLILWAYKSKFRILLFN